MSSYNNVMYSSCSISTTAFIVSKNIFDTVFQPDLSVHTIPSPEYTVSISKKEIVVIHKMYQLLIVKYVTQN